jgi:hypothetical protein
MTQSAIKTARRSKSGCINKAVTFAINKPHYNRRNKSQNQSHSKTNGFLR